jgi:hypothetical protein
MIEIASTQCEKSTRTGSRNDRRTHDAANERALQSKFMGALEVSPTRLIIRYPETFVLQSVREIYATIRKDACG